MDLLELFIEGNNQRDENVCIEYEFNEIGLLDKEKFKSLKYLKEMTKTFVKFENLIRMIPISLTDQIWIRHFYNLNMILYLELEDIRKHHALKLAYIIRRFHFVPKELVEKSISIFNHIINRKGYDKYFLVENNFINMLVSKKLNDYIYGKMTNIPKIKTNFENNVDCIDITDYQDSFILFIEFIYKSIKDYSENKQDLIDVFDSVIEAGICDMRSYRIFKNDLRRKKDKKNKKKRKEKKEQKKNKYKIVKNNSLNDLDEIEKLNSEENIKEGPLNLNKTHCINELVDASNIIFSQESDSDSESESESESESDSEGDSESESESESESDSESEGDSEGESESDSEGESEIKNDFTCDEKQENN
jgi:hypothetical protein